MKGGTYPAHKERDITRRLILSTIGEDGATRKQIEHACSYVERGSYKTIRILREEGLIHIGAWIPRTNAITGERKSGMPFAVFMLGDKDDAPKPKPLCKRKVNDKYLSKNRALIRAKALAKVGKLNMWDQLGIAA
jgi:hypothetical protein